MLLKSLLTALLGCVSCLTIAASPKQLVTHNHTNVDSNAYIDGVIASQHPTKANSDNKVFWGSVRIACVGRTVNNECRALIKMATNTDNPVDLGWAIINLQTGDISPKYMAANGYRFEVNGPGETTLSYDR